MGYPPTVGELAAYLGARPARREKPYTLRINIDSFALLDALLELTKTAKRPAPVDIVLEIDSGGPRGGIQPGADLAEALGKLRAARDRVRVGALLCYDAIAAGEGDPVWRANAARFAQSQLSAAVDQIRATAADFVDVEKLIRNGPGSANYPNWAGGPANEFAAGSAILFANYLDNGFPTAGLHKALYLCAPVLRLPKNAVFDVPHAPAGYQFAFVKAGGWPTGNNPTLSKLVHPPDLQEGPVYGRGANSSGMISAPVGSLALADYVVETCQQVMEGQNYFGALHAARDGSVRRLWPVVSRWSGRRMEV
jgi:hypothetical protein